MDKERASVPREPYHLGIRTGKHEYANNLQTDCSCLAKILVCSPLCQGGQGLESPCETTRITNQIFGKVGLLTSERQIGVLPEGGGGRGSKEGDGVAL
jgi:hypothetical protein